MESYNIRKLFVTYEQAIELKSLGFNYPTFFCFDKCQMRSCNLDGQEMFDGINYNNSAYYTSQPSKQQCLQFFRDNYSLYHNIYNYTHSEPTDKIPCGFTFSIDEDWTCIVGKNKDGLFDTYYNNYEEAEDACINRLIELAKYKKNSDD